MVNRGLFMVTVFSAACNHYTLNAFIFPPYSVILSVVSEPPFVLLIAYEVRKVIGRVCFSVSSIICRLVTIFQVQSP